MSSRLCLAVIPALLLGATLPALAAEAKPQGRAVFAALKSLVGVWEGSVGEEGGPPARVEYRETAGGNALVELHYAGTPHEMMSVYHLDGTALRLTHYCLAGNQPRMLFDPAASTADDLRFVFDGGTNLDPARDRHMRSWRLRREGEDRLLAEWETYENGALIQGSRFFLRRAR